MVGSMRSSSRLLLLVWIAWSFLALVPAVFAGEMGASVQLVAPRAGATLAAGSMAELEWAPLEPFARFSKVEEWEAFLSLDGGATYPMRITPHLDQDLRRVRWQVPPFPTGDARILLRFGDERQETAVELPQSFSITSIAASPAQFPALEKTFILARSAFSPGEPALPGHAGVVAWVEGSRRGGFQRQVVAAEGLSLRARLARPASHGEMAVLASETDPPQLPEILPGHGTATVLPDNRRGAFLRSGAGPALAFDILLLIQRQNE
jgi:hypothetical protein